MMQQGKSINKRDLTRLRSLVNDYAEGKPTFTLVSQYHGPFTYGHANDDIRFKRVLTYPGNKQHSLASLKFPDDAVYYESLIK